MEIQFLSLAYSFQRCESVKVLVTQLCLTLCNPMDCGPGSSVHGTLQARILEWVLCPSPVDLTNPEIKPRFPGSQADSYCLNHQGSPLPEMVQKILIHVSENLEPQDCVLKLITA